MAPVNKGHQPRKRFGQNFLVDQNIIARIVQAINPGSNDSLIEVGPGQGALTDKLIEHCQHLDVIEIDRDLAGELASRYETNERFTLHIADVLKFDFNALPARDKGYKIIGNLPYNISTPLLFHLFEYKNRITEMVFMLQLEVVDRMCAKPGNKSYGRLSIMSQYHCHVEKLFHVPATAFRPPPKVESAIVRLSPLQEPSLKVFDPTLLEDVVRAAFSQRRKTLQNSLKKLLEPGILEALSIDGSRRAETLSLEEYVSISNALIGDET